ncbi:branched-chain amino acid transporter [Psychromonas sp. MB-3u-54]|uniref:branched-chain amino acid transporter permease n=1 Tax=Psychromonas sp. MB-3u-54 TaxID=2058319 RepID=UPI000C31F4A9|nr:AzlD domain-containing protein [Psychromonas sp. MB-3u-54]PKH03074.1 branched-chain amino acid transporter [Psychromonas sp. MB-3u-54]
MQDINYLLLFILVMAVATFITRVLPFILLYKISDHPMLIYLGRYLPPVMMVLLLIYCFKDLRFSTFDDGPAELLALLLVVALHLWRANALLSIMAGTGLYMYLSQSLVLAG